MKRFEITYKNLNIVFGDNVFTKIFEGETPEKALDDYAFEKKYIVKMISTKEL